MTREMCRSLACRWFEEVWNQRRPEVMEELTLPESVAHSPSGDPIRTADFLERVYKPFVAAFPDLHISVEGVLQDEDEVAVRWQATGTHQGDGMGLAATGRAIRLNGVSWIRFRGDWMVECWDCWDFAALMGQLTAPASA